MSQAGSTRKRGATWTAYWFVRDAEGRRVQRTKGGFRTKREAQAHLTETLARVQDGSYSEPADRKMTVAEYTREQWMPSLDLRPATVDQYTHAANSWVLPHIGGERLAALTPAHIERMVTTLRLTGSKSGKPLSARSVQIAHLVAKMICAHALQRGYLLRNPVDVVKRPKAGHVEMKAWNADEVKTFLTKSADDRLRAAWVLFLARGPRRGEIAGMRWTDVDLDAGRWRITHTRISIGWEIVESQPKTSAGRRSIPLDPQLVSLLKAHRRTQLADKLAAGPDYMDSGYVFTDETGAPYHPGHFSDRWEKLVAKAGVPRIRLHDARHTAATLMLANGTPTKVAAELLGHASTAITEQLYQHVMPGMAETAGVALSRLVLG